MILSEQCSVTRLGSGACQQSINFIHSRTQHQKIESFHFVHWKMLKEICAAFLFISEKIDTSREKLYYIFLYIKRKKNYERNKGNFDLFPVSHIREL